MRDLIYRYWVISSGVLSWLVAGLIWAFVGFGGFFVYAWACSVFG